MRCRGAAKSGSARRRLGHRARPQWRQAHVEASADEGGAEHLQPTRRADTFGMKLHGLDSGVDVAQGHRLAKGVARGHREGRRHRRCYERVVAHHPQGRGQPTEATDAVVDDRIALSMHRRSCAPDDAAAGSHENLQPKTHAKEGNDAKERRDDRLQPRQVTRAPWPRTNHHQGRPPTTSTRLDHIRDALIVGVDDRDIGAKLGAALGEVKREGVSAVEQHHVGVRHLICAHIHSDDAEAGRDSRLRCDRTHVTCLALHSLVTA